MPYYDEVFKHLIDRFPYPFAALALKTDAVEVGESLSTEQPTVFSIGGNHARISFLRTRDTTRS